MQVLGSKSESFGSTACALNADSSSQLGKGVLHQRMNAPGSDFFQGKCELTPLNSQLFVPGIVSN